MAKTAEPVTMSEHWIAGTCTAGRVGMCMDRVIAANCVTVWHDAAEPWIHGWQCDVTSRDCKVPVSYTHAARPPSSQWSLVMLISISNSSLSHSQ